MNIFKIYTPGKVQNSQMALENFSKVYSRLFSKSATKKTFVISRKALKNFFEGCTHDYFQNIHHGKGSKQPNDFKDFFQRYILDYF